MPDCYSCDKEINDSSYMLLIGKPYHDKCVTPGILQLVEEADKKEWYLNQRPYNICTCCRETSWRSNL